MANICTETPNFCLVRMSYFGQKHIILRPTFDGETCVLLCAFWWAVKLEKNLKVSVVLQESNENTAANRSACTSDPTTGKCALELIVYKCMYVSLR